jgi:large subunit ribosomal protein L18
MAKSKGEARDKRKLSIRKRISGSGERPRLTVFRSLKHTYAQIVDDGGHATLVGVSTLDPALRDQLKGLKKKDRAKKVGALIATRAREKGIERVVFDRNGYRYHGRVAAVAQAAREAGLKF